MVSPSAQTGVSGSALVSVSSVGLEISVSRSRLASDPSTAGITKFLAIGLSISIGVEIIKRGPVWAPTFERRVDVLPKEGECIAAGGISMAIVQGP